MGSASSTYPLNVKLRWLAIFVQPVAINSGLVDTIELPLDVVQVCLAEGPCLGQGQVVQLVPYIDKGVVGLPEGFGDFALSIVCQLLVDL